MRCVECGQPTKRKRQTCGDLCYRADLSRRLGIWHKEHKSTRSVQLPRLTMDQYALAVQRSNERNCP